MGEFKDAFSADGDVKLRTHVGGQALIEGIMMRGRYNWAVAVREPSGNIYTEEHDLASGKKKNSWMYWPVIRGCTAFVESLVLGYKALDISSAHAYDWDAEELKDLAADEEKACAKARRKAERAGTDVAAAEEAVRSEYAARRAELTERIAKKARGEKVDDEGMGAMTTVSMIIGVVLGIAIFVAAPAAISNLILGEEAMNGAAWNILDGLVRVAIFIAYIWLISLMRDVKRMFMYHGAEHKTIHAFEHGVEMTPENCMSYPRLHVRCGTAFIIMVMIIAIFVYTALGAPINSLVDMTGVTEGPIRFMLIVLTRIVLMPLIAGCSYEITVKWAGKRPNNPLVRVILWPGMQMQRLTTRQPDEGCIECAIAAMNLVLAREAAEEAKVAGSEGLQESL